MFSCHYSIRFSNASTQALHVCCLCFSSRGQYTTNCCLRPSSLLPHTNQCTKLLQTSFHKSDMFTWHLSRGAEQQIESGIRSQDACRRLRANRLFAGFYSRWTRHTSACHLLSCWDVKVLVVVVVTTELLTPAEVNDGGQPGLNEEVLEERSCWS